MNIKVDVKQRQKISISIGKNGKDIPISIGNVITYNPVTGTIDIKENGQFDVKDYAYANVDVVTGQPLQIATSKEMDEVLNEKNIGKVYEYIGDTNEKYTKGALYLIEEE